MGQSNLQSMLAWAQATRGMTDLAIYIMAALFIFAIYFYATYFFAIILMENSKAHVVSFKIKG